MESKPQQWYVRTARIACNKEVVVCTVCDREGSSSLQVLCSIEVKSLRGRNSFWARFSDVSWLVMALGPPNYWTSTCMRCCHLCTDDVRTNASAQVIHRICD